MSQRKLTRSDEERYAEELKRKYLGMMVPTGHKQFLVAEVDEHGQPTWMGVVTGLKITPMGRTQ